MKVLSLFDGISCGHVALDRAGIPVERYVAYEIEKSAIKITQSNFPDTIQGGDVTKADFTQYPADLLIGGSPCQFWSGARAGHGRETTADGLGWSLFQQYVRAKNESGARWFLYENNASIHQNIKDAISDALGVQPIEINSALVSAQNRRRCYWTNIPNVAQPADRGILLSSVLEHGTVDREIFVLDAPLFRRLRNPSLYVPPLSRQVYGSDGVRGRHGRSEKSFQAQ